ncbi:MAG: hypothetical protein Q9219_005922 [cf. Caloplaca sp. 3 TL-2023]
MTVHGCNSYTSTPTNLAAYQAHHDRFAQAPLPSKPSTWIERAADVSRILAEDAYPREKDKHGPFAEISLLKSSGLLKVLGPRKYGGGDAGWSVAGKVIREVAKGDGSLAILLGYHLLWSWLSAVVGTDEQNDHTQRLIMENNLFIGGAINTRDDDQPVTDNGDHVVFPGFNLSTGSVISDLTFLEGSFSAHLCAAETLADQAADKINTIYAAHSAKVEIPTEQKEEVAEWVANVEVVAADTALRVTSAVSDVTGTKATGRRKAALDRQWKDVENSYVT